MDASGGPLSVSYVLPTMNEANNIGRLIDGLIAVSSDYRVAQVIVVDDNSTDGTREEVMERASVDERVVPVFRSGRGNLVTAIQEGIDRATGDVVVWMDTDLSMPVEVVPRLLAQIDAGYDMAIGSRFVEGGGFKGVTEEDTSALQVYRNLKDSNDSLIAVILSRLLNYSIWLTLGFQTRDYTSGFIAGRRTIFDSIRLRGDYGEYCIDMLYRARIMGYRLIEVGYICKPREHGESKTGADLFDYARRGIRYVTTAVGLRFTPKRKIRGQRRDLPTS